MSNLISRILAESCERASASLTLDAKSKARLSAAGFGPLPSSLHMLAFSLCLRLKPSTLDHQLKFLPSYSADRTSRCPRIALVGLRLVVLTGRCRLKLAMTSMTTKDPARALENEDIPHPTEDKVLRMVILQTESGHVDCLEHVLIMGCGPAADGRFSNNGSDKNWDRRRDSSFGRDRPSRDRFSPSPRRGRHAYRDRDRDGYRSPSYDSRSRSRSRSSRDERYSGMGGPPSKEIIMEGLAAHLTEDDVRSLHPTQAKASLFSLIRLAAFYKTVC